MVPCTLCSIETTSPILEGNHTFCCPGCHAVFNILGKKNQLTNYQDHPLFRQAVNAGLISNPLLLEQIRINQKQTPFEEIKKLQLEIQEMWCPSCAEVITLILLQEKGVTHCLVDYATDLAFIEYSPRNLSKDQLFAIIRSLGYEPHSLEDPAKKAVSLALYLRFIVAAFCSFNLMMFAYPIYASYFDFEPLGYANLFSWMSLFISLPVITYSAYPIFRRFFTSLQTGLFGMESLVVMGVAAAFGLSIHELLAGSHRVYFDSMGVIVTFVLLGKIIEAKAKFSTKETLFKLTRTLPRRGRKRFADLHEDFVNLKDVEVGDLIIAFAGEKIVLDGIVIEGEGSCDESMMTGEVWPLSKSAGSKLLAGALLQQGKLVFRVTRTSEQTALHKIIETLEKDIGHKSVYIRSADLIVRWFVPLVFLIALLAGSYCLIFGISEDGKTSAETAMTRAVSILLISCPCAIGIAAPLAESCLMSRLAGLGAIVRNRGCLSLLGKETVFVFDKTGTVTQGKFTVLKGLESLSSNEKKILKGMTKESIHPISQAIFQAIPESPFDCKKVEGFIGKGLRWVNEGNHYLLGSAHFLQQFGVKTLTQTADQPMTSSVYFAINERCLAHLLLGDQIREEAPAVVKELASSFLTKTVLLSGDSASVVQATAQLCHFTEGIPEQTPFDKKEYIQKLRKEGEIVCMLGDGINDALALTEAHIGISVVSAADISIQVSDILLTSDRLTVIPLMRSIAKKGQKIIKQNLFWAFFYNVIGIGLAVYGALSPIFAAFAMIASSLIVLFNARRLLRET